MEAFKESELRNMSYSSLKKYAKKLGVKGNMKTDRIIKSILSRSIAVSDDDSFVMHEQQIMNSHKTGHYKFDEDKENQLNNICDEHKVQDPTATPTQDPTATPRRETYSVESPSQLITQVKESELAARTSDKVLEVATPMELSFPSELKIEPVALNTSRRRETFSLESPSLPQMDVSVNSITLRKSSRKSTKPKVSFVTPLRCSPRLSSSSSGYASVKDRPKTPATRNSLKKNVQFEASTRVTPYKKISDFLRSRPSTPYRLESGIRRISVKSNGNILPAITFTPDSEHKSFVASGSMIKKKLDTLQNTPGIKQRDSSTPKLTPGAKAKILKSPKLSTLKKQKGYSASKVINTPRTTPVAVKSVPKRAGTPNFQAIHQKAFLKMESIDEYHKRKLEYSVKKTAKRSNNSPSKYSKKGSGKKVPSSKIPVLHAGPFVTSIKDINLDFGAKNLNKSKDVSRNTRQQKASAVKTFSAGLKNTSKINDKSYSKKTFDLQASLAKKLTYVPHKGTLKPLSEYNAAKKNLSNKKSVKHQKEKNIQKIREESKQFIHGVRTNRKFEDMMKRRQM